MAFTIAGLQICHFIEVEVEFKSHHADHPSFRSFSLSSLCFLEMAFESSSHFVSFCTEPQLLPSLSVSVTISLRISLSVCLSIGLFLNSKPYTSQVLVYFCLVSFYPCNLHKPQNFFPFILWTFGLFHVYTLFFRFFAHT